MEQLQQLLMSLLQLILLLLNPVVLIPAIIITVILIKKNKEYKEGAYYQITKLPYFSVKRDTGRYGEYLTYKYLKDFEKQGAKFLFNIYIPKENGETTEIDVLMLCSKGLFVFESKNYSGWIFGNETQKNWYQTLPAGRGRSHKEHFYNPIMQNRSHIKHLKAFLGEQTPTRSIVTFSDRCTLKSVQIKSNDVSVINRYNVYPVVSAICDQMPNQLLTDEQVNDLYKKLYPYTQVDAVIKAQHIANIQNSLHPQPINMQPIAPVTPPAENTVSVTDNQQSDIIEMEPLVENAGLSEQEIPQIPKCPKCNAPLILRTASRGANAGNQFYGCSNYPKCRYIQNIHIDKQTV